MDRWALPGPASTLAGIAERILAGEHIVFCGFADFELRLAVEPKLNEGQRHLRPIIDDQRISPSSVLWRENSNWQPPEARSATLAELVPALGRDTWWIEEIAPSRAAAWSTFLVTFADAARNLAPRERPTVVLCLPKGNTGPSGLTITKQATPKLSRADLEVAARYMTAAMPDDLALSVRIALAVEIASDALSSSTALDTLQKWLDAPGAVLVDPSALIKHSGLNLSLADATSILWRAQYGPVTYAIDDARCCLLRMHSELWRLPYTRPIGHPFQTTILTIQQLELSDLIEQLTDTSQSRRPLLSDLKALRHARNKLSHLNCVNESTFQLIARLRAKRLASEELQLTKSDKCLRTRANG